MLLNSFIEKKRIHEIVKVFSLRDKKKEKTYNIGIKFPEFPFGSTLLIICAFPLYHCMCFSLLLSLFYPCVNKDYALLRFPSFPPRQSCLFYPAGLSQTNR